MASSAVHSALSLLEPTLASNGEPTRGRWGRDEPTYGRPTRKGGRSAQFLVSTLLVGPPCHIRVAWLVLRRFGCSGGLVDPRERV